MKQQEVSHTHSLKLAERPWKRWWLSWKCILIHKAHGFSLLSTTPSMTCLSAPWWKIPKCAVMLNFLAKQIKTKQDVKSLFELVLKAIVSAFIDSSSELMEPQFLGHTNSKRHSSNSSIHAFCNQHTHYVKLEVPQKILFQISNIHITGHWRFAVSKPLPSSSALAQSSATPAMPWEDHFHFRWGWGWGWIWGGFFQWKTGR